MATLKERIRDILLREKILKPEDLERALQEQARSGGDLSKLLIRMGLVNEEQIAFLLSEGLQLPIMNISRMKIDPSVVAMIPLDVLKKYKILPVSCIGGNLALAMADPLNVLAIDDVRRITKLEITPLIASEKAILDRLFLQPVLQTRLEARIRR